MSIELVAAVHRDHGVDLGALPYWRLGWCVSDDHTTVRSTDPWALDVAITLEGERLHAIFKGDLSLVDTRRTDVQ